MSCFLQICATVASMYLLFLLAQGLIMIYIGQDFDEEVDAPPRNGVRWRGALLVLLVPVTIGISMLSATFFWYWEWQSVTNLSLICCAGIGWLIAHLGKPTRNS